MRSSGGKRLNNPKKVLCCNVTFLDDAVATYEVPKDAKGSVLYQSVVRSLDLNLECKYFGLLFTDEYNFPLWLDHDKKIRSQLKTEAPYKFEFRVKYYVSEPGCMLTEELTRYQFVLQLKQDMFHQRLSCTFRTLALLASFIVQSELGDYDPKIHKVGYLREFKFVPNQPSDLESEIKELHAMHLGLTPEEVELKYLEKAKWLTAYGVDMRSVKDCHGLQLKLGIAPSGIQVYQGGSLLNTFEWPRVTKLKFHQKKFLIKVQPKEPGSREQEHSFIIERTKHCKALWKICIEHHDFYKSLPPIDRNATLHRSTSQKSHRNGTQSRANIPTETPRERGDQTPRERGDSHHTPRTHRSQPNTPHRNNRSEAPRNTPARPQHVPRVPDYSRKAEPRAPEYTRAAPDTRPRADYYNSLPRKRHDYPGDTNRYNETGYYDKNITNYNNQSNGALNKRSKSIGAGDVLDLDYPEKQRPYSGTNYRTDYRDYNYGASNDAFRTFFTDTVLQNKTQYHSSVGKSWANNVNYEAQPPRNGSKSTPDVRLAASQPAFMTSSAMRQANFLMTTEL